MSNLFPKPARRGVSTRLETIAAVDGLFHPVVGSYQDDRVCPHCERESVLPHASARSAMQCHECTCVIDLTTGNAYMPAEDAVPAASSVGAEGQEVPVLQLFAYSHAPRDVATFLQACLCVVDTRPRPNFETPVSESDDGREWRWVAVQRNPCQQLHDYLCALNAKLAEEVFNITKALNEEAASTVVRYK